MNLALLEPTELTDVQRDGACVSGRAVLEGARARQLDRVLRPQAGGALRLGLVNGPLGTGRVLRRGPDCVELELELTRSPPPSHPLKLILALPRPKVLGRVLRAIAALGVKDVVLVNAARVEKSYWHNHRLQPAALRRALWDGLERALDTLEPRVQLERRFRPFVEDRAPGWCPRGPRLVGHPAATRPLPLPEQAQVGEPATLAIGPEPGWVDFELEQLARVGFEPCTLGPRMLHVEVALPALLALLARGARPDSVRLGASSLVRSPNIR